MRVGALSRKKSGGTPVYLLQPKSLKKLPADLPDIAPAWIKSTGFAAKSGELCLVPEADGRIGCALFGLGTNANPMLAGRLARSLPAGDWHLAGDVPDPGLSCLGYLLGAYRFDKYRKQNETGARLISPKGVDLPRIISEVEAVNYARDLINTPTSDLGPAELEDEIRQLAKRHGARVTAIRGDDLLKRNFPMVHAVGRASASPPRIVDLKWGSANHPKITLVGKGVCFDTGGLNIKPGSSMALMKKDMGGAANVLALAHMVMSSKLPVRLRVIIAAVENSISGNAFRPGDVLASRKGITVEIGNTDAEGRLVLGDALVLGDEETPEIMIDMATLTGAARVALGTDLPAMFCNKDAFANELSQAGKRQYDPMWRLPLWQGYRSGLSSEIADINHIGKGGYAGAIMAALFLERFVEKAGCWAHFDIFAWNNAAKPWGPVGGEAFAIRAIHQVLTKRYPR
ncbi:MAG: leucyl aminopeptidase family protein [Pseudomonadota bacterium]